MASEILNHFNFQGYNIQGREGGVDWKDSTTEPWGFRYRFACVNTLRGTVNENDWSQPTDEVTHFHWRYPKIRVGQGDSNEQNNCAKENKFFSSPTKKREQLSMANDYSRFV